jgi:hypothetical protein
VIQVVVLSFTGLAEAQFISNQLQKLSAKRQGQSVAKLTLLYNGLSMRESNPCKGDLFVGRVINVLKNAVESQSVNRRAAFPIDKVVSALEAYVSFIRLEHLREEMARLESSEEFRGFLDKKTEMPLFKQMFDTISLPDDNFVNIFGNRRNLADTTWAALSWRQRLLLKQSFITSQIWINYGQVCSL